MSGAADQIRERDRNLFCFEGLLDLAMIALYVADVVSDWLFAKQLYTDNSMSFFWISVVDLCMAHFVNWAGMLFICSRWSDSVGRKLTVMGATFVVAPVAPIVWCVFEPHVRSAQGPRPPRDYFVGLKHYHYLGFTAGAMVEALPQMVLQVVYVVGRRGSMSRFETFSITMSMLTLVSRSFMFAQGLTVRTRVMCALCWVTDTLGFAATAAWLAHHALSAVAYHFLGTSPSLSLLSVVWLWQGLVLLAGLIPILLLVLVLLIGHYREQLWKLLMFGLLFVVMVIPCALLLLLTCCVAMPCIWLDNGVIPIDQFDVRSLYVPHFVVRSPFFAPLLAWLRESSLAEFERRLRWVNTQSARMERAPRSPQELAWREPVLEWDRTREPLAVYQRRLVYLFQRSVCAGWPCTRLLSSEEEARATAWLRFFYTSHLLISFALSKAFTLVFPIAQLCASDWDETLPLPKLLTLLYGAALCGTLLLLPSVWAYHEPLLWMVPMRKPGGGMVDAGDVARTIEEYGAHRQALAAMRLAEIGVYVANTRANRDNPLLGHIDTVVPTMLQLAFPAPATPATPSAPPASAPPASAPASQPPHPGTRPNEGDSDSSGDFPMGAFMRTPFYADQLLLPAPLAPCDYDDDTGTHAQRPPPSASSAVSSHNASRDWDAPSLPSAPPLATVAASPTLTASAEKITISPPRSVDIRTAGGYTAVATADEDDGGVPGKGSAANDDPGPEWSALAFASPRRHQGGYVPALTDRHRELQRAVERVMRYESAHLADVAIAESSAAELPVPRAPRFGAYTAMAYAQMHGVQSLLDIFFPPE